MSTESSPGRSPRQAQSGQSLSLQQTRPSLWEVRFPAKRRPLTPPGEPSPALRLNCLAWGQGGAPISKWGAGRGFHFYVGGREGLPFPAA